MKKFLPAIIAVIFLGWLAASLKVPDSQTGFDVNAFGRLPVLANGRIKPMDTVARTSLVMLLSKETIRDAAGNVLPVTPTEWLMDLLMRPAVADNYKVFIITNPDVLGLFHWDQSRGKYYSFSEIEPFLKEIDEQATTSEGMRKEAQGLFQREIIKLRDRIILYNRLKNSWHNDDSAEFSEEIVTLLQTVEQTKMSLHDLSADSNTKGDGAGSRSEFFKQRYEQIAKEAFNFRPIPKAQEQDWQTAGDSLLRTLKTGRLDPAVTAYVAMSTAYHQQDKPAFNKALGEYQSYLDQNFPQFLGKTGFEFRFNHFEPFYQCIILYICVFLLALFSWLFWHEPLNKSAFWLLAITFVLHTGGLIARMWMQGRPPVTNLYSSAIFVGWAACGLCLLLEKIHRNGIGSITAATMGFITLIIAHHLSFEGDTLEMLRAVLDTNFWLATHVVAVTLGYSATFLAGFLAIIYVIRGVFTASLDKATAKSLASMVYGIICFAMLFSFVGTVLGGIWADQSWGRFWGFDPKENGALLIVIWNAVILHARWGGLIRERGLMNMAMFGNIVTSFSWFGVNMLGAGLHSYGFMDKAVFWLYAFDANQLLLIGVGMLPLSFWGSFGESIRKENGSQPPPPPVSKSQSA